MNTADGIAVMSLIVTFVGVIVAGAGLWQLNQQLVLQHFADYTKRYQEIILRFPEDVNEGSFKLQGREDYKQTMRAMRAYFDLCFEEWYLNERGSIDQQIWELWNGGMKTAMSKPAFQQAWDLIVKDTEYGDRFKRFVDRLRGNRLGERGTSS